MALTFEATYVGDILPFVRDPQFNVKVSKKKILL